MIEALNISKKFDDIRAVSNCTLKIEEKQVFGLIGTNGAGKSTIMRMLCGVLKPDEGCACIDQKPVYDNPEVKKNIFFASDEPYFFPGASAKTMMEYFASVYPDFDRARFNSLIKAFEIDENRKISGFSKGMKKQLQIITGICSGTKYLLCDETFDGLDPVVRQGVKSLFAQDMEDRGLTPVISSHNLRELEDICDNVGLIHKGGIILSENMEAMKLGIQKVQCVLNDEDDLQRIMKDLKVVVHEKRGRLHTFTIHGSREDVEGYFRGVGTVFFEMLALSLEEIFISETEAVGYDVKKFIIN